MADITSLLARVEQGRPGARDELYERIYEHLYGLARRQLGRFGPNPTLNTTVLVHELYLKLEEGGPLALSDRRHLFAVAATAMRQIVIDYARRNRRAKRGGDASPVPLERFGGSLRIDSHAESLLAVDQALQRLAEVDERLARIVELRFFGGFSVAETAETLGISSPTVKRDTRVAKAFLQRELRSG